MPTLYTRRLLIVVSEAMAPTANTRLATEPEAGDTTTDRQKTFTVPLSASGALPATHRWCGWQMKPETETMLTSWRASLTTTQRNNVRIFDAALNTPEQVLTTMGLRRIGG